MLDILRVNRIQYLSFCECLSIFSGLILIVAYVRMSFLFMAEKYFNNIP